MLCRLVAHALAHRTCQLVQVDVLKVETAAAFIQTGQLHNVIDQREQAGGLVVDAAGKTGHILGLGQTVADHFGVSQYRGQRGFELVGDVCGKHAAGLFGSVLRGDVQHQHDHAANAVIDVHRAEGQAQLVAGTLERVDGGFTRLRDLCGVQNGFVTLEGIERQTGGDRCVEQTAGSTAARQNGQVLVEQNQTFVHACRDGIKFDLLAAQCGDLQRNLLILRVESAQKRGQLVIHIGLERLGGVDGVDRTDKLLGQTGRDKGRQQTDDNDDHDHSRNGVDERAHKQVGRVGHTQHVAARQTQRDITGQLVERGRDADALTGTCLASGFELRAIGMIFHRSGIGVGVVQHCAVGRNHGHTRGVRVADCVQRLIGIGSGQISGGSNCSLTGSLFAQLMQTVPDTQREHGTAGEQGDQDGQRQHPAVDLFFHLGSAPIL